jgi:quercetin dioxygenase-like cupin family protein
VEVPFVAIIKFDGDKIAHEHLYWDQASVLVQIGLLDRTLPVCGGEIADQVLNRTHRMNELICRAANNNEPRSKKENPMRKAYWLGGTRLSVLAGPADTEGRYDLVEGWFPAGTQIPPHRHRRYSEQICVLEGEFTVWAGKRKAVLRPGDDIFIPPGTAHAWHNTGAGPGRAQVIASPSGFARLVTEVGTPDDGSGVPPSTPTDMDLFHRISAELGDEILGLPGLCPPDDNGEKTPQAGRRPSRRVDLSHGMIGLAEAEEARQPLGIEHRVGDARSLGVPGQFDLVFAAYLLHDARRAEELTQRCRAAHALRSGGRFVAVNNHPTEPPPRADRRWADFACPAGEFANGGVWQTGCGSGNPFRCTRLRRTIR